MSIFKCPRKKLIQILNWQIFCHFWSRVDFSPTGVFYVIYCRWVFRLPLIWQDMAKGPVVDVGIQAFEPRNLTNRSRLAWRQGRYTSTALDVYRDCGNWDITTIEIDLYWIKRTQTVFRIHIETKKILYFIHVIGNLKESPIHTYIPQWICTENAATIEHMSYWLKQS